MRNMFGMMMVGHLADAQMSRSQITVGDSTLCAGLTDSFSTDSKTYTLLTSVHNDADTTDDADDIDDYNREIGIAQLKAKKAEYTTIRQ